MKWILCNRTVIYPFLAPIKLLISRVSTGNEFHVLHINVLPCNCFNFVASKICSVLVLGKIFWSSHLHGILFSLISVLMSSSIFYILLSFFLLPLLPASRCFHMFGTPPFASDPFWKNSLPSVNFYYLTISWCYPALQPPRPFSSELLSCELIKVPRPCLARNICVSRLALPLCDHKPFLLQCPRDEQ